MKKTFTAFCITLSVFLLSSCRGLDGRDGMDGRDGRDAEIHSVLVNVDYWRYSGNDTNNYFYADVDMPEITRTIFDRGVIKAYRVYDFESEFAVQTELPFTFHNEEWRNDINDWYFYTETIRYDYYVGGITFYYTTDKFDYELDEEWVPLPMQFRCVVMY